MAKPTPRKRKKDEQILTRIEQAFFALAQHQTWVRQLTDIWEAGTRNGHSILVIEGVGSKQRIYMAGLDWVDRQIAVASDREAAEYATGLIHNPVGAHQNEMLICLLPRKQRIPTPLAAWMVLRMKKLQNHNLIIN
jgi:hypothetical protein